MAHSPAEELKIASRRLKAAELYLRGERSLTRIAAQLKVDKATASRDFKAIRGLWKDRCSRALAVAKAEELAKVNLLEKTYWRAWRRSLRDKEGTTTETISGGESDRTKAGTSREGQSGNPAFLAGIQWCIEQRCDILGLKTVKRVTIETIELLLASLPYDVAVSIRIFLAGPHGPGGVAEAAPADGGAATQAIAGEPPRLSE